MLRTLSPTVAIVAADKSSLQQAQSLAQQLILPLSDLKHAKNFDFILIVSSGHLSLQQTHHTGLGPLMVDYMQGTYYQRLKSADRRELIARAVGWKSGLRLTILDATAGLGRDGFLLASLGCAVTMLERSPIVAALLRDGLQRALVNPEFNQLQIELQVTDAMDYLQKLPTDNLPEVIYLDPMFPERTKTAQVKKEMQYLQALLGSDEDIAALFMLALQRAKKRVVLKRPKTAALLANDQSPDIQYQGKDSRFDVYFIR